jgi:AraC-like DNA-binding protein
MNKVFKFTYKSDSQWLSIIADRLGVKISDNKLALPAEVGSGSVSEFEIENGFYVAFGEMIFKNQVEFVKKPDRAKNRFTIFFKYLEGGSSVFVPSDGAYKEVTAGGVHFISSNVAYHLFFPAKSHNYIFRVHVTMDWLKRNLKDFISQDTSFNEMIFSNEKVMHFEPLTNRFLRLFRDVFKSEFDQKLNHLIVKDKGYEAVVLFFDHFYKKFFKENINYSKYSIEDQKQLYSLIDFIKGNMDQNMSLDELARKAGFSKSKLQAMFHHFFHQSIYAFIKNVKLEHAVELLKSTNYDIRYIAHQLGYNSSTHFINIFKKHYGLSPKKFRSEKLSFHNS